MRVQGYVRLHTNLGDLNIELHCDQVPLMCENFLLLAERGFFDNTTFHRLIPGFMVRFAFPPPLACCGFMADPLSAHLLSLALFGVSDPRR